MPQKIIISCGPSSEPIDEVRRITNYSTGALGVKLAESISKAGFDVVCFKGAGATWPDPNGACLVARFETNDDLLTLFQSEAKKQNVMVIFHVAALCDYKVMRVRDENGHTCQSAKIASRAGSLSIELEPATKVIASLRNIYPNSLIVGWKYELTGSPEEAIAKAKRQIHECRTNGCVINGRAYGEGFSFFANTSSQVYCHDKTELVHFLTSWVVDRQRRFFAGEQYSGDYPL